MRYINVLDISLYQIQLFLEVAEKENITQAANCKHVTQSMLSKMIKNIENTLGLQIFFHEKSSIRLTPAGKILKEEFITTISRIEKAIENAHACQEAQNKSVVIAFPDTYDSERFITPLIKQYISVRPSFQYNQEACGFQDIARKLLTKEFDISFSALFDIPNFSHKDIDYQIIRKCMLQAFMRPSNPLSKVKKLTFDMLKQQSFITLSVSVNPNYINNILEPLSKRYGFIPKISYYASSAKSVAVNLQNDNQIFIADKFMGESVKYGLIAKNITETESGIIMAWRKNSDNYIMDFVNSSKQYYNEGIS